MSPRETANHLRYGRAGLRVLCLAAFVLPIGISNPVEVCAQAPRWQIDLSGSRIQYDTTTALNAPSISTLAEWQRPSTFARLSGSGTGFQGAGWSAQGRGDVAGWLSPLGALNPLRLEFAGTGGGSRHSSGFSSFIVRGDARIHARGRSVGGWTGASLASARNSLDTASVTGVIPSAGLWVQRGPIRATLSYVRTKILGDTYPEANLAISLSRGPIDLTVYGGLRQSPFAGVGLDERWGGATGALWINPQAALIVAAGRYSSDVMQGLPGGRFASVGIRLTRRRARPIPLLARAPIVYTPEATRAGSIGFEVDGARRVEIAGDWNAWQRVPLSQDASGRWIVPVGLGPGVYRFNLWVDDERWIVPEGVSEIDDGYGGRVGLLIISNPG